MATATSDTIHLGSSDGGARDGGARAGARHGGGDDAALGGTWGTLHAAAPLRVAHWPGRPGGPGTVVLVHGRAEFIEVYDETIRWLVGQGFAVIAFDFRGQGGSRRRTRGTGHVASFREYVDDLSAVVRHAAEIGLPRPFHILGHSMGGLVALLAAEGLKREVERMVLLAPLLGIERLPLPVALIGLVTGAAQLTGLSRLAAGRMPTGGQPFEGNRITSDPVRYARLGALVDRNPGLATGAPTLGWLRAALGAIRRARRMEGRPLPIPTLFVASGADTIVSTAAIDRFARSVAGGGLVIVPHARHQVLIERDELRAAALAAIATFLVDAPQRIAKVPQRSGRRLRFTPEVMAPATAPAPAMEEAPAVEAAPQTRPGRRGGRLRDRLRRREDRVPAAAQAGDLAAPHRQEPRLGTAAAAAPADGEDAAAEFARTVVGLEVPPSPAAPGTADGDAAGSRSDAAERTESRVGAGDGPIESRGEAEAPAPAATVARTADGGEAIAVRYAPEPWQTVAGAHAPAETAAAEERDPPRAYAPEPHRPGGRTAGAVNGHPYGAAAPNGAAQQDGPDDGPPATSDEEAGWPDAFVPPPARDEGADVRSGNAPARVVDRRRRTPPPTPRPVRGKGGRKR